MSEQRIHTGADAATGLDADEGEGQGLQRVGSHGDLLESGGSGPVVPGPGTTDAEDTPDTEGARYLAETQQMAGQGGDEGDRSSPA